MAFSQMSSKEKTVVAVLGVVILIALVGIGILVARFVTSGEAGKQALEITVAPTATGEEVPMAGSGEAPATESGSAPGVEVTNTPIAPPSLEELEKAAPGPISSQPEVVARMQSPGPGLPVIIAGQPLHAGRRYRLEITAADGSKAAIQGSWSQSATSASGKVTAPQMEFFEATTPYEVNIVSPVGDPVLWGFSVSAGPKDVLGQPSILVITIWDDTGVK